MKLVPDSGSEVKISELDERLLATPPIALERCGVLVKKMAELSVTSLKESMNMLLGYDSHTADEIRENEDKADHYEDILGTYLVKLSGHQISDSDSCTVSKLLKAIGDFERISDHSVNIVESAEEINQKQIAFSETARSEIEVMCGAVSEILTISYNAFMNNSVETAKTVEPLEQVIDGLKKKLRNNHIARLKKGDCSIEAGFVWADLLTNLERVADHCSNVAVCVIDAKENNMNVHESLRNIEEVNPEFNRMYNEFKNKYSVV